MGGFKYYNISSNRNQLLAIPDLQNKNPDHMISSRKTVLVNKAGYWVTIRYVSIFYSWLWGNRCVFFFIKIKFTFKFIVVVRERDLRLACEWIMLANINVCTHQQQITYGLSNIDCMHVRIVRRIISFIKVHGNWKCWCCLQLIVVFERVTTQIVITIRCRDKQQHFKIEQITIAETLYGILCFNLH